MDYHSTSGETDIRHMTIFGFECAKLEHFHQQLYKLPYIPYILYNYAYSCNLLTH